MQKNINPYKKKSFMKIMPKKINQPKTSIIIVNYNGEEFLKILLNSLKKTKYSNYEIIFVDNASVDNSIKIVEKNYPKVKIIKNINNGFAGGLNAGIKSCSPDSEYIVPLNYDMYVHQDWLSYLIETIRFDKKIAIVGYSRLFPKSDKIETLGNKCLNANLAKFKRIGARENIKKYMNKEYIEVDFCLGLTKMSVLREVGIFDEKYFAMYEEVDLCRRIKDAGYKIVVNPKAKVWHFGSQSIKKTSAFRIYYSYRNRLMYVLKHNKGFNKLFYGKILCLIYFYKILKFSFKGRFDLSWAILKGIGWNIRNLRDYF